ncbi:MAG TPA: SpoIIE family protein phosphatase [Candidatus Acidoferrales bacterium]|nr:SpoIIE family protein phosphatase [Candidatus Acidoferrales bacterium]
MSLKAEVLEHLRLNILLEDILDEHFDFIKPRLKEKKYSTGQVITEDGCEETELHLIYEGRIKVTRQTKFGDEYRIALLHPGDFFGETSLIDGRPRTGRVSAVDDCITYALGKEDFNWLLEKSHPFALRLLLVSLLRFRSQNHHFMREIEQNTGHLAAEVEKLEQIIEASKLINSALDLDELLKVILDIALKIVDGETGTVYLVDRKKHELWSKVFEAPEAIDIHLPLGKGIAGYVGATGDTLNIPDAYLDARFNPEVDKKTGYRTKTILCMPMMNKDGAIVGVFQLLNKNNGTFTSDDENAINALSIHAAIAIEKARLYEEEHNKIALEKELSAAHAVQVGLLPEKLPQVERYEFAARSIPAKSVAGDLYDLQELGNGNLSISLGDVSGKGMPAALLMANVQATVRAYSRLDSSTSNCVKHSNDLLFGSISEEKFVTLFYGVLDAAKNLFRYTNAGHEEPLLFHGSRAIRLKTGGVPLGVVDHFPYEEEVVQFNRGDVLIIYSDGMPDAVNSKGERFGEERFECIVKECTDSLAEEIADAIFTAVNEHVLDTPQFDDMTLLVVKRKN